MAAPSHRLRFLVGLALGAALGAGAAWVLLADARRDIAGEREARRAVVALQALSSLLERTGIEGDAARRLAADWQAATPGVTRVRAAAGTSLEISTAPEDVGERAAPRRLAREEKDFYDRGHRIAAAVQTNRDEQQALRDEIEVEAAVGGRLSLAGPAPANLIAVATAQRLLAESLLDQAEAATAGKQRPQHAQEALRLLEKARAVAETKAHQALYPQLAGEVAELWSRAERLAQLAPLR